MGYGGDLIWTGVFKVLHEEARQPICIVHRPKLTDILCGRLYNGSSSLADSPIFRNNPRLEFSTAAPRPFPLKALDLAFSVLIKPWPIKTAFERRVFRRAEKQWQNGGKRLVHVDMVIHSYAEKQLSDRFIWKQGGHVTKVIAQRFTDRVPEPTCELYFQADEEAKIDQLLSEHGIEGPFIAIDNGTNRDWFGDLRSWPTDRWQEVVDQVAAQRPGIPIVQIGVPETPHLPGTIDLRGKTSFREAALVIRKGRLFIGTESGPMHAARAVGTPSVILWGGVTLPEFAGYPDHHRVLCHYVDCAPCGRLGTCPNDHICMNHITSDEVITTVLDTLNASDCTNG